MFCVVMAVGERSHFIDVRGEPGPERDKLKAREYKVLAAF